MSTTELEALERDVETARARLIADLARVRSAGNASGRKLDIGAEASRMKDEAVGSFVDGIKARVAANPAAAVAIGAGLAWRLYRHPPIATALVGAGLYGLLRADPRQPALGSGAAKRAVGFGVSARDRFEDWRSGDGPPRFGDLATAARHDTGALIAASAAKVSDAARSAKDQVVGLAGAAQERASALAHGTRERVGELGGAARERIDAIGAAAGDAAGKATARTRDAAGAVVSTGRRTVHRIATDEHRDQYLLGAAGLAIAAAIGLAYQRRYGIETPVALPRPRGKAVQRPRRPAAPRAAKPRPKRAD